MSVFTAEKSFYLQASVINIPAIRFKKNWITGDAVQDRENWVPETRPVTGNRWTHFVSFDWDNFEFEYIDICAKCA
jgi:hypothetical protein